MTKLDEEEFNTPITIAEHALSRARRLGDALADAVKRAHKGNKRHVNTFKYCPFMPCPDARAWLAERP